jgi:UDP-N-acetylmuramate--alanine ligase
LDREAAPCTGAHPEQTAGHASQLDLDTVVPPIHFIGIGGIGMSAIARLLLAQGRQVSGSDQHDSEIMQELAELGAKIYIGHAAANAKDAGTIVVSTAITAANPELSYAKENGVSVMHRSDLLRYLSQSSKLLAVSGTHGKTTTTGMISQVLLDCGLDPSVVVGGIFTRISANSRLGQGEYFVAEADESDRTHGQLTSYIAVITNIEPDHLENYPGGMQQIKDVMISFANKTSYAVVICHDDFECREIMAEIAAPKITYGKYNPDSPATYQYESLPGASMRVYKGSTVLGEATLSVPGEHNKLNALSAIAIGCELGLEFSGIARALNEFRGVDRRFQLIGEQQNITVVDDYAHHPTEVVATLQGARQYLEQHRTKGGGNGELKRVVALFQPHQPTRLRDLWDDFVKAFAGADCALIADVYVARGSQIEGINSKRLVQAIEHPDIHYIEGSADQMAEKVLPYLRSGDLLLTMGAGDVTKVGPRIVEMLKQGQGHG